MNYGVLDFANQKQEPDGNFPGKPRPEPSGIKQFPKLADQAVGCGKQ